MASLESLNSFSPGTGSLEQERTEIKMNDKINRQGKQMPDPLSMDLKHIPFKYLQYGFRL